MCPRPTETNRPKRLSEEDKRRDVTCGAGEETNDLWWRNPTIIILLVKNYYLYEFKMLCLNGYLIQLKEFCYKLVWASFRETDRKHTITWFTTSMQSLWNPTKRRI